MRDMSNAKIFLVSFLMLFLEMSLIRWISTEIRIFAYVNNLVLLACFLGIGLGCYYSTKPSNLTMTFLALLALMLLVTNPVVKEAPMLLSVLSRGEIWFPSSPHHLVMQTVIGLLSTLTIFSLIATAFAPLGQILGQLLSRHPNTIVAYSLNIAASLAGVWYFNFLSFSYLPPWVWFAAITACLTLFTVWTKLNVAVVGGLLAAICLMAAQPFINPPPGPM